MLKISSAKFYIYTGQGNKNALKRIMFIRNCDNEFIQNFNTALELRIMCTRVIYIKNMTYQKYIDYCD